MCAIGWYSITVVCVSIDRFLQESNIYLLMVQGLGTTLMPEAESMHATHPRYRVARVNQQYITGAAESSKPALQAKRVRSLTRLRPTPEPLDATMPVFRALIPSIL